MEYVIVSSSVEDDFHTWVNRRLKAGWECQGGVSVVARNGYTVYYQAMIRKEDRPQS